MASLDPSIHDKTLIFQRWPSLGPIVLDLGCGPNKRHQNWIGVDKEDYHCVDLKGDVFDVLDQIGDNTVDHIYSSHFFEHMGDISQLMSEITRVLKVGGTMEIIVPHFSNPYFFSDYTHKTFFGLYSFSYFADDKVFKRRVPMYHNLSDQLILRDVKLIFKSTRPFYFRYAIKRVFNYIFNMSRYMQELYEENFCYFINCYELHFQLRKEK